MQHALKRSLNAFWPNISRARNHYSEQSNCLEWSFCPSLCNAGMERAPCEKVSQSERGGVRVGDAYMRQTGRIIKLTPTRGALPAISYINSALCTHISPCPLPIEIRSATVKQTNQQLWLKFQALFNAIPVLNNENAHRCFCQKRLLIPGWWWWWWWGAIQSGDNSKKYIGCDGFARRKLIPAGSALSSIWSQSLWRNWRQRGGCCCWKIQGGARDFPHRPVSKVHVTFQK